MTVRVAIALVWRDGKLLVTQRPGGTHLERLWEFPGGKLEPDETPEICAEREVLEETGLIVRALSRRAPIEHAYPERRVELHPVDCAWISGEPEKRQVAAFAWIATDELERYPLPAANAGLVRELSRGLPRSPR
jgi:mutator protein MutT